MLIFSTMTMLLDSVEEVMEWAGLEFLRLDGTTKGTERGQLITDFTSGKVRVNTSTQRDLYPIYFKLCIVDLWQYTCVCSVQVPVMLLSIRSGGVWLPQQTKIHQSIVQKRNARFAENITLGLYVRIGIVCRWDSTCRQLTL